MRQRDVHGVHHPDQVDVDCIDERVHRFIFAQRADARVGHDDVELAQFGDAGAQRLRQRRAITHVSLDGDDAPAGFLDELGRLVEVLAAREWVVVAGDVLADVHRSMMAAPSSARCTAWLRPDRARHP